MNFDIVATPVEPGLSVIEASAGTGKTYAISHLVPRLLLEGHAANLAEVVLVTFTKDAARELAARVRRVLAALANPEAGSPTPAISGLRERFGAEKTASVARAALRNVDLLNVSTIHSFCQGILAAEGTLCGFPVPPEIMPSATEWIGQMVLDLWEARLGRDADLAAFALDRGWSHAADVTLATRLAGCDAFEACPPAPPFREVWNDLLAFRDRFDAECISQIGEFDREVGTAWKGEARELGEEGRRQRYAAIQNPADFASWFEAARWIAGLPDCIHMARKNARALARGAEGLAGVILAREVLACADRADWAWRLEVSRAVSGDLSLRLRNERMVTYDSLITAVRDALLRDPEGPLVQRLRERFRVGLIDESQDTDLRQMEIFRQIFLGESSGGQRLVLVGDPKQAIYAFRGANVETYLEAKSLAGSTNTLTTTFRSPARLVSAINALFEREGAFLKPEIEFPPAVSGIPDRTLEVGGTASAPMEIWVTADDAAENFSNQPKRLRNIAEGVAGEIVRLFEGGAKIRDNTETRPVGPGDFCVLVSQHDEAAAVVEALKNAGVPAIRGGGGDVMQSEEASDLLALLRAVAEPRRSALRRAALATRFFGLTAPEIARGEAEHWVEGFSAWRAAWHAEGFASMVAAVDEYSRNLGREGLTERLALLPDGERRLTNFRQLVDLLAAASVECGGRLDRLLRWLAAEITRESREVPSDERQIRLESDDDAVHVVTMHSAKGLQFPLVFCPFLWSHKKPTGVRVMARASQPPLVAEMALADEDSRNRMVQAEFEDRIRLLYVSLTRAEVKVWIWGGAITGSPNRNPLDWLLDAGSANFSEWVVSGQEERGAAHWAFAQGLEKQIPDSLLVRNPPEMLGSRWVRPDSGTPSPLRALPAPDISPPRYLTSFSALTRESNPHGGGEIHAPKPRDVAVLDTNSFFAAPGGTEVGSAVHEWIEKWDFREIPDGALEEHFSRYILPPGDAPWPELVRGMLGELAGAQLPGSATTVAEACADARASEWHFQLPLRGEWNPGALAAAFERHGQPAYAKALGDLTVDRLHGYLHGFLDRIAHNPEGCGVIDWKTNMLGSVPEDYSHEALVECATRSHYFLQAHLYLVALRRYLPPGSPVPAAWLVFLRAVKGGTPRGILSIAPPPGLLDELDALFAPPHPTLA